MTTQMQSQTLRKNGLLRWALYGDAVFSGVSGLMCIVAANPISQLIGISATGVILALGIFLVGYAAVVWFIGSRPVLDRSMALWVVVGNGVWVIGSVALLITNLVPFSIEGRWIVAIVAALVDTFATLQFVGWRRLR